MTNIRSKFQTRIDYPPSSVTDPLFVPWLRRFVDSHNAEAPISVFSEANPNQRVSNVLGAVGVNLIAASSATSVLWVRQQGASSSSSGWIALA